MGRKKGESVEFPKHKGLSAKWRHNPPTHRPLVGEPSETIATATARFARGEITRAEMMQIINADMEQRRKDRRAPIKQLARKKSDKSTD